MKKKSLSLKWGLLTTILLCWIAAVVIVVSIAGILLNSNFERNLEQTVKSDAENILNQVGIRLSDCMESSKEVSYDGVIRSAYRQFLRDADHIAMYRTMTEYISNSFSRDAKFRAVFISFWEPEVTSRVYVINQKNNSYQILQEFITQVRPVVLEDMASADTQIRFLVRDGDLYMCRNLMDSGFRPYATVTMLCDTGVLLQPLQSLTAMGETKLSLDEQWLQLDETGLLQPLQLGEIPEADAMYETRVDDHTFSFYVAPGTFNIWTDMPGLRTAVAVAFALVLPILAVMISVFYKTVSEPVATLVSGAQRVQDGERGYQIETMPNNQEFQTLYRQFNAMSQDLKQQFDRSQLEQQALQQAKIKALQSQINPHFLNNTLEVINWEARLAGNDNVSEMIDALSTMLDAALDRDGTGTVALKRELEYADAYLHIIHRRLGDRFHVSRHVDETLLECRVPKLVLQPIVENAVEHDITPRKGGNLEITAGRDGGNLVLKVTHQGTISAADRENIDSILASADPRELQTDRRSHVGLRNVAMRLKLLYGERSSVSVEESEPGMILAQVVLPIDVPM